MGERLDKEADVDRAARGGGGDGDELYVVIFKEFLLTTLTYLVACELVELAG